MKRQVITREKSKSHGLKRFYTGVACKHGHICERFVINKVCVECSKIRDKQHYQNNTASEIKKAVERKRKKKANDPQYRRNFNKNRKAYDTEYRAKKANALSYYLESLLFNPTPTFFAVLPLFNFHIEVFHRLIHAVKGNINCNSDSNDNVVKDDDVIAVWFSCGAASAVAAKLTIEKYPNNQIRIINNPVAEEHPDNTRFLKDVEKWLNHEIEFATNKNFPKNSCIDVWYKAQYMSSLYGAPCTVQLKKQARYQWEKHNHVDFLVLGYTVEEQKRNDRFMLAEKGDILPILIDAGINKRECFRIVEEAGIELPEMYKLGYPNANCIGCVKSTSPTYWNHVRKVHPIVFEERAAQSKEIGTRLVKVKGERIFLDELDPETKGRKLKDMDFECGIVCPVHRD